MKVYVLVETWDNDGDRDGSPVVTVFGTLDAARAQLRLLVKRDKNDGISSSHDPEHDDWQFIDTEDQYYAQSDDRWVEFQIVERDVTYPEMPIPKEMTTRQLIDILRRNPNVTHLVQHRKTGKTWKDSSITMYEDIIGYDWGDEGFYDILKISVAELIKRSEGWRWRMFSRENADCNGN